MNATKPKCGHTILRPECGACKKLLNEWYLKLKADPTWHDIEYGLEHPKRIYQPVDIETISPEATDYYDKVWEVFHAWTKEGRSPRDCLVAELLAKQDAETGTERGIAFVLKSKRLKPYSRFMVTKTIKEINGIVLKIGQGHLSVEQGLKALRPVDSKPIKEEANGKADPDQSAKQYSRAA